MKMNFWIKKIAGGMSLTCILALLSCNGNNLSSIENGATLAGIPDAVYEDFQQCFPDAADVAWTVSDGYAVAAFTAAATRSAADKASVWYELKDAKKKMYCRTIAFETLPEAVRNAFAESEHAAGATETIAGMLTRYTTGTVETIYILRTTCPEEGAVATKTTLYYTADGILVKQTSETVYDEDYRDLNTDCQEWLPQTSPDYATAFVERNYPQAEYLYIHAGENVIRIKILDGRQVRLLQFDTKGNWLFTQTHLHADQLPEIVLAAFRSSEYADCKINDAEEYLTADNGDYYVLIIKNYSGRKQEIHIDADGTLDNEGNWNMPAQPGDEPEDTDTGLSKTEAEAFIGQRYPGATILKQDYDEKGAEVELSYNGAKIKIRFARYSQGYVWTDSEWDLDIYGASSVPALVQETIDTRYAGYQLYFLKYVEQASGIDYYEAGLKSAQQQDIKVKMNEQGDVLAEYGKH